MKTCSSPQASSSMIEIFLKILCTLQDNFMVELNHYSGKELLQQLFLLKKLTQTLPAETALKHWDGRENESSHRRLILKRWLRCLGASRAACQALPLNLNLLHNHADVTLKPVFKMFWIGDAVLCSSEGVSLPDHAVQITQECCLIF